MQTIVQSLPCQNQRELNTQFACVACTWIVLMRKCTYVRKRLVRQLHDLVTYRTKPIKTTNSPPPSVKGNNLALLQVWLIEIFVPESCGDVRVQKVDHFHFVAAKHPDRLAFRAGASPAGMAFHRSPQGAARTEAIPRHLPNSGHSRPEFHHRHARSWLPGKDSPPGARVKHAKYAVAPPLVQRWKSPDRGPLIVAPFNRPQRPRRISSACGVMAS